MSSPQEIQTFVKSNVQEHQVVIFAKSYCPYCDRTKDLFASPQFRGIDVKIYDLDHMENGGAIQRVLLQMTGQRTVPSVWVNGEFIGGNSETQSAWQAGVLSSSLLSVH